MRPECPSRRQAGELDAMCRCPSLCGKLGPCPPTLHYTPPKGWAVCDDCGELHDARYVCGHAMCGPFDGPFHSASREAAAVTRDDLVDAGLLDEDDDSEEEYPMCEGCGVRAPDVRLVRAGGR